MPQAPAQRSFQQPQAQQPGGKPAQQEEQEKRADISDIGDLLFGSGIDEKTEEEFMSQSYRKQQQTSNQTKPTQYGQQTYTQQQQTSFDLLSGNAFQSIGQRPGNLGPPVKTAEDVVDENEQKRQAEIHTYNERTQRPLEDPFLWGNSMRFRMERIANDNGIKIPMQGLFDKINNKPPETKDTKEMKHKEEGGGSIVAEKAPSILNKNVPLDGIMSLMSLATNERIRDLLEDAYALTRGRQMFLYGDAPVELVGLLTPPESRQLQQQLPNGNAQPSSTPSTPMSVENALAQLSRAERQAEEARLKKRAERRARKEAAAANGGVIVNGDTISQSDPLNPLSASSGNTPGPAGLIAPEGPKMTKKEREKLAKQDVSEEVQMKQANSALSMALGGGKKKYSWLTNGGKGGGSGAGTPGLGSSRSGTPGLGGGRQTKVKMESDASPIGKDGLPNKELDRKYGVWREDGPGGKDVQLRDWVAALDFDGREKRTLATAMTKLGRERLFEETEA